MMPWMQHMPGAAADSIYAAHIAEAPVCSALLDSDSARRLMQHTPGSKTACWHEVSTGLRGCHPNVSCCPSNPSLLYE